MSTRTSFGLALPNYGPYTDPGQFGEIALLAEESGWDGIFLYDTFLMPRAAGLPVFDPWINLTVMADRTSTIRIGTLVSALPRLRPWQIARIATTIDHVSGGRFILGVGAGDPSDKGFGGFGEPTDGRTRARLLDESIEIINGLWSGEPFSFDGDEYTVDNVTLLPKPAQSPHIPVWVACTWPAAKPIERAARQDGVSPILSEEDGSPDRIADTVREIAREFRSRRGDESPFDIVIGHPLLHIDEDQQDVVRGIADAGATWIVENLSIVRDLENLLDGIKNGPPAQVGQE